MALIQPTSSQGQELNTNPAKRRFVEILHERDARQAQRLFYALFPEANTPWSGPPILGGLMEPGQILYARSEYPKHLEFFRVGSTHRERCFMCANRIGKTLGGGGGTLVTVLYRIDCCG